MLPKDGQELKPKCQRNN